jgi:hypothetical protein
MLVDEVLDKVGEKSIVSLIAVLQCRHLRVQVHHSVMAIQSRELWPRHRATMERIP